MRRIQKPQALAHARVQISAIHLERHVPPDIHLPQIDRRVTVSDPLRHHLADAARRLQSDGVQSRGDEAVLKLRGLAEVIAHVRCEALGAAEELLNAGALERGHAAHGIDQHGLEVGEIPRDLTEGEIIGDALACPRVAHAARMRPRGACRRRT